MYIVNDDIPLGCVYEDENGKTKYCPMLNHDDVPYCQWLEDDEAAIGIDERPVYCPIVEFPYADVPDTNVGDMISRQAAIDAVDNYIGTFDAIDVNFLDGLKTAKKLMMQLPSAQPTQLNTHNTLEALDCISRQAAIEACLRYNGVGWVWSQILDEIKEMPSAVVQCKDCKFWRDTDHTCKEHSLVSPMGAEEFCSRGERKGGNGNG